MRYRLCWIDRDNASSCGLPSSEGRIKSLCRNLNDRKDGAMYWVEPIGGSP